mgnify:FL=1
MCNPQAHLDAKQEKLERFKKKTSGEKVGTRHRQSSFPNPTEDYDARSVAAPNNPSFEELLEIGMKLQNQPAPPSPEEPIVKKGPKTQSLVGMTRELQKKVSIISYHGALYFFNGRYYEYLDTDRLLMLYREYVDYDLNHESSLYGHKDLYQCCATDPEIQREEPKGEPIYAPLKNGIFVLGEEKLYPHSPDQLTFTCIKPNTIHRQNARYLTVFCGRSHMETRSFWNDSGWQSAICLSIRLVENSSSSWAMPEIAARVFWETLFSGFILRSQSVTCGSVR